MPADRLARLVLARDSRRGHHHAHRRPRVPLQPPSNSSQPFVDHRLEQVQQVGLQPHQQRLGLRVAEPAVELQHPRPLVGHHQPGVQHAPERAPAGFMAWTVGTSDRSRFASRPRAARAERRADWRRSSRRVSDEHPDWLRRQREARRLRTREGGAALDEDRDRNAARSGFVHVSRAVLRAYRRLPHRHVLARHRAVRARHGAPPVQGRERVHDDGGDCRGRRADAIAVPRRRTARARRDCCSQVARQGSRVSAIQTARIPRAALEDFAREHQLRASNKALADYLLGLFGQRLEPWHTDEEAPIIDAKDFDRSKEPGIVVPPSGNGAEMVRRQASTTESPLAFAQAIAEANKADAETITVDNTGASGEHLTARLPLARRATRRAPSMSPPGGEPRRYQPRVRRPCARRWSPP